MSLLSKKTVDMLNMDYKQYSDELLKLELDGYEANKDKIATVTAKLAMVVDELTKRPTVVPGPGAAHARPSGGVQ